jgi:hypothetical protein
MAHPRYSTDEIVARGKEIYEKELKSKLEPQNIGKFLVIDVETGDYEMDDDDLAAALRAYKKKPEGARYEMQIGYATSGTIGGAYMRAMQCAVCYSTDSQPHMAPARPSLNIRSVSEPSVCRRRFWREAISRSAANIPSFGDCGAV